MVPELSVDPVPAHQAVLKQAASREIILSWKNNSHPDSVNHHIQGLLLGMIKIIWLVYLAVDVIEQLEVLFIARQTKHTTGGWMHSMTRVTFLGHCGSFQQYK